MKPLSRRGFLAAGGAIAAAPVVAPIVAETAPAAAAAPHMATYGRQELSVPISDDHLAHLHALIQSMQRSLRCIDDNLNRAAFNEAYAARLPKDRTT